MAIDELLVKQVNELKKRQPELFEEDLGLRDSYENLYLSLLVDYVPILETAQLPKPIFKKFSKLTLLIATDARNEFRKRGYDLKSFEEDRNKIAKEYTGWLAHDLSDLHKIGMPPEALNKYVESATRTCFTGRAEHDHLLESTRLRNYERARDIIKGRLVASKTITAEHIGKIFETVVYGDDYSGLNDLRTVTFNFRPDEPPTMSEEYKPFFK